MIYKCPKCGSEIRFWCFEQSTNCDCEQCTANFYDAKDAENYARMLDSERWRKISEEPPKGGEGYSTIIVRYVDQMRLLGAGLSGIDSLIESDEWDDRCIARLCSTDLIEWRPVYGC